MLLLLKHRNAKKHVTFPARLAPQPPPASRGRARQGTAVRAFSHARVQRRIRALAETDTGKNNFEQ